MIGKGDEDRKFTGKSQPSFLVLCALSYRTITIVVMILYEQYLGIMKYRLLSDLDCENGQLFIIDFSSFRHDVLQVC